MKRFLFLTMALTMAASSVAATPSPAAEVLVPWHEGRPQFKTLHNKALHKGITEEVPSGRVFAAIAGGKPVAQGAAPYAVRLEVQPSKRRRPDAFCSGALIAPRYVLTAAHCIADSPLEYPALMAKSRFKVRFANVAGKPVVSVASANYWRNFSPSTFGTIIQSDLAILRLAGDGPAQPVALSAINETVLSSPVRELGYGPRKKKEKDGMQSTLYAGDMRFASPATCSGTYAGKKLKVMSESEFCTQATPPSTSAGACHGDSGGPALSSSDNSLIGVTSWSIVENCDVPASKRETVFARVDASKGWLQRQTGAALFGEPAEPQDLTVPNAARSWVYDMNSRQVIIATSARQGEGDEIATDNLRVVTSEAGVYYATNGDLDGFTTENPNAKTDVEESGRAVTISYPGSSGPCYVVYIPTGNGGVDKRSYNIFCAGGDWKATTMIVAAARTKKKVYIVSTMVATDANDNGIRLRFPTSWRNKSIKAISVETYGRFYNRLDNGTSPTPEAVTLR